MYREARELPAAIRLLNETVTTMRKKYGLVHERTVNALADLSDTYRVAANRDGEIRTREELRDGCAELNGPNHHLTLLFMNDLAVACTYSQRFDDAIRLLEPVRLARIKEFGMNHKSTLMYRQT